jgi:putative transposase
LVEGHGVPLSLVVTGAHRHDITQLDAVLDAIIIARPLPSEEAPQKLYADKAYVGKHAHESMVERHYLPRVIPKGMETHAKKTIPGYRSRRWVVEACNSWFNRFRKLIVRYEKTSASYIALHHLAAAIICWRKIGVIYG